jgi:hypothetical protein
VERVWLYNLGPGRANSQVVREVRAILGTRPAVAGLVEALYDLPGGIPDYELVRSTTRPGRTNIAAYVRKDLGLGRVRWVDLEETWGRTERPGIHPPRSFPYFRVGRAQVIVHHQCPKHTDNTIAAQREGIRALTKVMAPWTRDDWDGRSQRHQARQLARPRILLWDPNRGPDEPGPGPATLARAVGGKIIGQSNIEAGLTVNARGRNPDLREFAGGIRLRSNHHHAFTFDLPDSTF